MRAIGILAETLADKIKRLVDAGMPEETARKVASGELPMAQASRMARANEQGFLHDAYHASLQDIDKFVPGYDDGMIFTTPDTDFANNWLGKGKFGNARVGEADYYDRYRPQKEAVYKKYGEPEYGNPAYELYENEARELMQQEENAFKTVYPLKVKADNIFDPATQSDELEAVLGEKRMDAPFSSDYPTYRDALRDGNYLLYENKEVADYLRDQGYDAVNLREATFNKEQREAPYTTLASLYPENIRSVNAAFDPDNIGKPDLLGALSAAAPYAGGAGILAAGMAPEDAEAGVISRGGKKLIEAWHGSPHKFDKFSMDNIGTGEGAQAYGHGLYFADAKDVSKSYIPRDIDHEDWMYQQYKANEGDPYMAEAWERAMQHEYPSDLRELAIDPDYEEQTQAAYNAVADALEENPPSGMLAKVELDVDPDTLLDWDKPLSEQSEGVRKIMGGALNLPREIPIEPPRSGAMGQYATMTGGDAYAMLGARLSKDDGHYHSSPKQKAASAYFLNAGIPGIRYRDGMSRDGGSGTSNYVMFDDAPISIVERGNADIGLLGALGAGAAALSGGAEFALDALDIPYRGLLGLTALGGNLASGSGWEDAVRAAATIARQPVEETTYNLGGAVVDQLSGTPFRPVAAPAGALTHGLLQLLSPI